MTPEEKDRLDSLCKQIQIERDPKKFSDLLAELNVLLEAKENRLTGRQKRLPMEK